MRPINVTLDSESWERAKQKENFSGWVRHQLFLDKMKTNQLAMAEDDALFWKEQCDKLKAIIKELRE